MWFAPRASVKRHELFIRDAQLETSRQARDAAAFQTMQHFLSSPHSGYWQPR